MNSNKVVDLNAFRAKLEEKKLDEMVEEQLDLEKAVNSIAVNLAIDISDTLEEYGYNVRDNAKAHDLMMVIEAITSLAYRSAEEPHPMHDISDEMFVFESEEDFKFYLLDEE